MKDAKALIERAQRLGASVTFTGPERVNFTQELMQLLTDAMNAAAQEAAARAVGRIELKPQVVVSPARRASFRVKISRKNGELDELIITPLDN